MSEKTDVSDVNIDLIINSITEIMERLLTDEYKNLKREVRDDNWVVPVGFNHAVKIPIPFEVALPNLLAPTLSKSNVTTVSFV